MHSSPECAGKCCESEELELGEVPSIRDTLEHLDEKCQELPKVLNAPRGLGDKSLAFAIENGTEESQGSLALCLSWKGAISRIIVDAGEKFGDGHLQTVFRSKRSD